MSLKSATLIAAICTSVTTIFYLLQYLQVIVLYSRAVYIIITIVGQGSLILFLFYIQSKINLSGG